jgi:hypothetical protein
METYYAIYDMDGKFMYVTADLTRINSKGWNFKQIRCRPRDVGQVNGNLQQLCDINSSAVFSPKGEKYDRLKAAKREHFLAELDTLCSAENMDFASNTIDF